MSKTKIVMADIQVEIEGDENMEVLTDRALSIMTFLIPERVRLESAIIPGDEGEGGRHPEQQNEIKLPGIVMMHE